MVRTISIPTHSRKYYGIDDHSYHALRVKGGQFEVIEDESTAEHGSEPGNAEVVGVSMTGVEPTEIDLDQGLTVTVR